MPYRCFSSHATLRRLGLTALWKGNEFMKYAFRNGILLDGTKDMTPVSGKAVLVEEDRITDIVPDGTVPSGYEVIDLSGRYLLPGLINLHVHLSASGKPLKADQKPTDYKRLFQMVTKSSLALYVIRRMCAQRARTALMSGVTTIRTVAGILDIDGEIRDEINSGMMLGPRILSANTGISVPGGHFAGSIATEADSPEMAREHVREIADTRPDLIKLMITGGIMDNTIDGTPGSLKMSPEIVRAASEEAHEIFYQVAAHVESSEGVRVALENGVNTIEHGAPLDAHTIRLFKETGAADICTISPAVPYALFDLSESHALPAAKENARIVMEGIIACAKTCLEEGIPVGLGSDVGSPFIVNYNFWRELCYFHKYVGASNNLTLHTATLRNAEIAGIGAITGSIEPGKSADLIAVKDNPLDDLSALRHVSMVMTRGVLIKEPKYRQMNGVDELLDKYM